MIHIALLRGINVGGRNVLPMNKLAALCEQSGCFEVRTYIQSGNVVFESTAAVAKALPVKLSSAIRRELGLEVPVVLRSATEWRKVAAAHPLAKSAKDDRLLAVGFVAGKPSAKQFASLDPDRSPPDEFVVRGREVFLHFPNGVARSKLTSAYLDARLGTTITVRNWNTVRKIAELAG